MLDRIDYHVTVALESTKEGVKSLVEVGPSSLTLCSHNIPSVCVRAFYFFCFVVSYFFVFFTVHVNSGAYVMVHVLCFNRPRKSKRKILGSS